LLASYLQKGKTVKLLSNLPKQKVVELSIMAALTIFGSLFGSRVELHLFESINHCPGAK